MEFPPTMWSSILKIRQEPERIKELVYRRYWEPILGFACYSGLSREDAEDVTSEVFLRVCDEKFLEKADRKKGKFRSLLLAVTRHVMASLKRSQLAERRDRRREVSIDEFEIPDEAPDDAEFDRLWVRSLVNRAFEKLASETSVQALRMQMEGRSYKEIARTLGKTEITITNYISRAKQRMKKELEELVREYAPGAEEPDETRRLLKYL